MTIEQLKKTILTLELIPHDDYAHELIAEEIKSLKADIRSLHPYRSRSMTLAEYDRSYHVNGSLCAQR